MRLCCANIQITNYCNKACLGCPHVSNRKHSHMSWEVFSPLIDDLRRNNCVAVNFGAGEPTLNNDLARMVRAASTAGMRVSLGTNGSHCDFRYLRELCGRGLSSVRLSLASIDPKQNDDLRYPGAFDEFVTTARISVQLGLSTDCILMMRYNDYLSLDALKEFRRVYNLRRMIIRYLAPNEMDSQQIKYPAVFYEIFENKQEFDIVAETFRGEGLGQTSPARIRRMPTIDVSVDGKW